MADIFDFHKNAPAKTLIAKLNPIIRGWANYFSAVVSKKIFNKLDNLLWIRRGRWASRRHPNKSAKWVTKKLGLKPRSSGATLLVDFFSLA
ncbi:MAG: hypothetical protein MGG11_04390 [Trichodesmium sp. MAG_R03]|nr:hypothetical protein [Trichodesmium sp. MAG_R03]